MMAMPGSDTEYTCSTPEICDNTCSAGVATVCATSRAEAPGQAISTLAMVTLICGSSSRGVTMIANRPSSTATTASSKVICECKKYLAIRPEIPILIFPYMPRENEVPTIATSSRR
jgi:hypothetical protein